MCVAYIVKQNTEIGDHYWNPQIRSWGVYPVLMFREEHALQVAKVNDGTVLKIEYRKCD